MVAFGVVAAAFSQLGVALPGFFVGLVLIYVFALNLRWVPPGSYTAFPDNPVEWILLKVASKWSNAQYDKALDEGRRNLDQSKRAAAYKTAQQILLDEQPMIVFYNQPQISVGRKELQNVPMTYYGYWGVRDFAQVWRHKS